ncbi:MAG: DUF4872 domain-containing protein [Chloroflexi bacterium]|nr:MAG: DUF4872 domain-containing protein [Chloroflexota bacterium]
MIIENYTQLGGYHPETATLTNALAHAGVVNPVTKRPFTESMILGIGGGLGVGYILWEFKKHNSAIITLGYRNKWNYTVEYLQNACDRLGVVPVFHETGGPKKAATQLTNALEAGKPAITWIDQQKLPYFGLREVYSGCFGYMVNVFGLDETNDEFILDDKSHKPMRIKTDELADARARIGSYKNRIMLIDSPNGSIQLDNAIHAGINDCVEYLSSSSQTFSLPALTKWAKMMTDTKNKKGWPTVFKQGTGLYSSLRSLYESIKHTTTEGAALRNLYADFLDEAETVLAHPALPDAASKYREAANLWENLADTALPDNLAPLRETKRLLAEKYDIWRNEGHDGMAQIDERNQQLHEIESELNPGLPMQPTETEALFTELQTQLYALHKAETAALNTLSQVVA